MDGQKRREGKEEEEWEEDKILLLHLQGIQARGATTYGGEAQQIKESLKSIGVVVELLPKWSKSGS